MSGFCNSITKLKKEELISDVFFNGESHQLIYFELPFLAWDTGVGDISQTVLSGTDAAQ